MSRDRDGRGVWCSRGAQLVLRAAVVVLLALPLAGCKPGTELKYPCPDGTWVDWCHVDESGRWVCISSPENACRDTSCDDGTVPICLMVPPVCTEWEILAYQDQCYRCVNPATCRPWGEPGCEHDAECPPAEHCNPCGTSSCPYCDDCVPACRPHDCRTEEVAVCRMVRPDCENGQVAVIRGGCWVCVDLQTCEPPPTGCEEAGGYCEDFMVPCAEGYVGGPPMDCPMGRSAQCCLPAPACVEEGQSHAVIPDAPPCCEGLKKIGCDRPDEEGACPLGCLGAFVCARCGDGDCGPGENYCNCPADCWPECREPADCSDQFWNVRCYGHWDCVDASCQEVCDYERCGDGRCDRRGGETESSCPPDCRPQCQKPRDCLGREWLVDCWGSWACREARCVPDCPGACGDGSCQPERGEDASTCAPDCALWCEAPGACVDP